MTGHADFVQRCWELGIAPPSGMLTATPPGDDERGALDALLGGLGIDRPRGSILIRDRDGGPYAVVTVPAGRSARHAATPESISRPSQDRDLLEWRPRGALPGHARFAAPVQRPAPPTNSRGNGGGADTEAGVPTYVTIDTTVLLHGVRAELFAPGDRLVVSVAADFDRVGHTYEVAAGPRPATRGVSYETIHGLEPLPIDGAVMASYHLLAQTWIDAPPEKRDALSTGDLLCLATAAAFGLPLYTTRPGAYRFLRSGVTLVKYGEVRDESVVEFEDEPTGKRTMRREPPPITDPTEAATALEQAFLDGDAIGPTHEMWRFRMRRDPEVWGRVVIRILTDPSMDLGWKTFILGDAHGSRHTVRATSRREEIVMEVSSLASGTMDRSTRERRAVNLAALFAFGEWAEPSPEHENILDELEDGDELALEWLMPLLRIHGVEGDTAAREFNAIRRGKRFTRKRFDQLVAKAAAATKKD